LGVRPQGPREEGIADHWRNRSGGECWLLSRADRISILPNFDLQGPGYDFYRNKQLFDPKDKVEIEFGLKRVFGYEREGGIEKINQAIAAQVCSAILVQIDGMIAGIFSFQKFKFCSNFILPGAGRVVCRSCSCSDQPSRQCSGVLCYPRSIWTGHVGMCHVAQWSMRPAWYYQGSGFKPCLFHKVHYMPSSVE